MALFNHQYHFSFLNFGFQIFYWAVVFLTFYSSRVGDFFYGVKRAINGRPTIISSWLLAFKPIPRILYVEPFTQSNRRGGLLLIYLYSKGTNRNEDEQIWILLNRHGSRASEDMIGNASRSHCPIFGIYTDDYSVMSVKVCFFYFSLYEYQRAETEGAIQIPNTVNRTVLPFICLFVQLNG